MEILTKKQKMLLEIAKENGFINILDVSRIFSCRQKEQLQRLINLGFLIEDVKFFGHFVLTGKDFENAN